MKNLLSVLLAFIMAFTVVPTALAKPSDAAPEAPINADALRTNDNTPTVDLTEIVTVMVRLKDSPIAARVDDVRSPKAEDLSKQLHQKQQIVISKISDSQPCIMASPLKYLLALFQKSMHFPKSRVSTSLPNSTHPHP